MAYDSARHRLVVLGAFPTSPRYSTWERDDAGRWTNSAFVLENVSPIGMADDPAIGHVVLVTARDRRATQPNGGPPVIETWLWKGSRWSRIARGGIRGPPFAASLAYDPSGRQLILFGGSNRPGSEGNIPSNATYALGADRTWKQDVEPDAILPAPRDFAAFGQDPQSSRMLMFGGSPQGQSGDDTWLLDPTQLNLVAHPTAPSSPPSTVPAPRPGPAPPQQGAWTPVGVDPHPARGSWWALPDPGNRLFLVGLAAGDGWQDWAWDGLRRGWTRVDGGGPVPMFEGSVVAAIDGVHHRIFAAGFGAGGQFGLWEGDVSPPQLVGLGDSYTAGEGNPPYAPGTDGNHDYCHRSLVAYPLVAAQTMGLTGDNFSCSGASISDVAAGGVTTISQWPDGVHNTVLASGEAGSVLPEPKYVALTIGGNDLGFATVLQQCITDFLETEVGPIKPLSHCSNQPPLRGFAASLPGIQSRLTNLYNQLADAPNLKHTHFYVLGYPNIFSVPPPLGLFLPPNTEYVSRFDVRTLIAATRSADAMIGRAVSATDHPDRFTYVNEFGVLAGHELGSGDQWVNGFSLLALDNYENVVAFHPNRDGQAAMAACLVSVIRGGSCGTSPSPGPNPGLEKVFVSADTTSPGGPPIAIQIRGLVPLGKATIAWYSRAGEIRHVRANDRGVLVGDVKPPRSLRPGPHTLVVTARKAGGGTLRVRQPVTVVSNAALRSTLTRVRPPSAGVHTRNRPPRDRVWIAAVAAGVLLALGAIVVVARRRRSAGG